MAIKIDQEIKALPAVPAEGEGYRARAATWMAALVTFATQLVTWTTQANALADSVTADAATCSEATTAIADVVDAAAASATAAQEFAALAEGAKTLAVEKAGLAVAAAGLADEAKTVAVDARNEAVAAAEVALGGGIAKPAGIGPGDLLTWDAAGNPIRVPAGTPGQSLQVGDDHIPLFDNTTTQAFGVTQTTNALYSVCSGCTLENVGSAVTVTSISSGVCTTTNTQGLAVGRLVKFSSGSSAAVASKLFEVTAVAANVSFTLSDTSINPGAVAATSCYEQTQAFIGADTKAPDLWDKEVGVLAYIEHSIVPVGFSRALKVVGSASVSKVNWSDGGRKDKSEFYTRYRGKNRVVGCPVLCSTPNKARIFIDDGNGTASYSDYHPGDGQWHWLEVTRACAPTITSYQDGVDSGLSATAYFGPIQSQQGTSIGAGNFLPIPNEWVRFQGVQSIKYPMNPVTTQYMTALNTHSDSLGVIPRGAKALQLGVVFVDNAGSGRYFTINGSGVPFVPYGGDIPILGFCPVTGVAVAHSGITPCDIDGNIYIGFTSTGSNTAYILIVYTGVQL